MDRRQNRFVLRAKQAQKGDSTYERDALAKRDVVLDRSIDDLLSRFTDPVDVKAEDEEAGKWAEVQGKGIDEVREYLLRREDILKAGSEEQPDPEWLAYALRWYELRGL